ncbi:GNAT family N-acetyltransferase [Oceaniglobus indicus]|uniref:GNAT family N-acetyltransferase n=1 Tax=Oceaniglobus indicus TaxID=2047749 RepID=UPI000C187CC2|nr:GNAT family N-acetyltransferase [Oceaniglobus indicus]
MALRAATYEDASSIAALSLEVWLSTYIRRGINGFFADYALDTFTTARTRAILNDPTECVTVSDNVEGIDGVLRLTHGRAAPVPGCSPVEITTLYVQPRHQGRGIGAGLLAHAQRCCVAAGAPRPWLAVNAENTAAVGFYAGQGFEIVGETHFSIADQSYPNHIMSLRPDI